MVLAGVQDRLAPLQSWLFPRRVYMQLEDQAMTALVVDGDREVWHEQVALPEGLCVHGAPQLVEALGDFFGDLLVERGFAGARVKAVLPREATVWRVVEWPEAQWPDDPEVLVRAQQSELDLPWSLQNADVFLEPLSSQPPRSLLVAVQRDLLEDWIEVFNQAGVALDGLEALPICLWRAVRSQLGEGVQMVLELDRHHCRLLAFDQDQPLGDWELPAAGDLEPLADALQNWSTRYAPSGGIVAAADGEMEALLPELERWACCSLKWSSRGMDVLPLWGLAAAEIQP